MILDPQETRALCREMDSPIAKTFEERLVKLHSAHLTSKHCTILIPRFWCEAVFAGVKKILEHHPNATFGSIFELQNRLKIYTIPASVTIEQIKVDLYNKIDTLILESVERLANGAKKPFFAE